MGSSAPDTQTTTSTPWQPQGDQLQQLFNAANSYFQSGGPQGFEGSRVQAQNQNQENAQGQIVGNAQVQDQQAVAANQANQSLFNADDVGNNQIVSDAIQSSLNPLARQFTDKVIPALRLGQVGAGQTGSSRQGVIEANAARDFNETSSNLIGRMMGDFYGQGLDAKTKALSLSPALQSMMQAGAGNVAKVGDSQQIFGQQVLSDQVNKFDTDQNRQLNNLFNFKNLITGGFGGTATGPTGTQGPSLGAGAMGGAAIGTSIMPGVGTAIGAGAGALSTML